MKIIDFAKIVAQKESTVDFVEKGKAAARKLSDEDRIALLKFWTEYIVTEVEVGLGVRETDDDEFEGPIFERIDEVYSEAAQGCYFCDKSIDPNEPMDPKQKVCMMCGLKIKKWFERVRDERNKG